MAENEQSSSRPPVSIWPRITFLGWSLMENLFVGGLGVSLGPMTLVTGVQFLCQK